MPDEESFTDDKYVVYKSDDLAAGRLHPLENCVVIRLQDSFAPPALDTYANSILSTVETLKSMPPETVNDSLVERLESIADYFHTAATASWSMNRKLPD